MMKKQHLILGTLILGILPALAVTAVHRNALRNGPKIGTEFEKKSSDTELLSGPLARDTSPKEKKPRTAQNHQPSVLASGNELPSVAATVYDHATGSIGIYRLPSSSTGEFIPLAPSVSSYFGGDVKGNVFYACHDGRYEIYNETNEPHGHKIQGYDVTTWTPVGPEIVPQYYRASDLAINPADGRGYAYCDVGNLTFRLFSIDLETGDQTDINPSTTFLANFPVTVAYGKDGDLYSVTAFGYFGKVDISTGKVNTLSEIDIPISYKRNSLDDNWSMALDPDTGNFILSLNYSPNYGNSYNTNLYSINPLTGESSLIAQFTGKSLTSLFFMPYIGEDEAPANVTNLSASFPQGALSGTVTFNMPQNLFNGNKGDGEADWTLYMGSDVYKAGKATYGSSVSVPVSVSEGGKYYFSASASNSKGESEKSRLECWIGPDIPEAPSNVTVEYNEGSSSFLVKWNAVTTGVNQGYINPQEITYKVIRMPAEKTVAENLKSTSFTDNYQVNGVENIYYTVKAYQGSLASTGGDSPLVSVGYLALPYDMASENLNEGLANWIILDANNDDNTWETSRSNGVRYMYSDEKDADDWLITPPVKAYGGYKYTLNVTLECQSESYPERAEILWGDTPDPKSMTKVLLPPTTIDKKDGNTYQFEFSPEKDGKFHIGIHAISDVDSYYLYLRDFRLSAPLNTAAPAAPEFIELVADKSGALKASGKIKVPTVAENGSSLTSISRIEVKRGLNTVATFNDVIPGSEVEFTDENVQESGVYAYRAYAYNGEAMSLPSEQFETFVGVNVPGLARNVKIVRSPQDPKTAVLSWDRPDVDEQGYPLNGEVDYLVALYYDNEYVNPDLYLEDVYDTTVTFTPKFNGKDSGFVVARIYSGNSAGAGWYAKSQNIYIGEAQNLPFVESFPNYTLQNQWGDGLSNGPQIGSITDDILSTAIGQYNGWNRMTDASFDSTEGSQDHDNGFAGMFGWSYTDENEEGGYHNEYTDLVSPVINLSGVDNPVLTFYTYNWTNRGISDPNILDVDAVTNDGVRHNVLHQVIGDLGDVQDWLFVKADLSEFAGKDIYLIFRGTIISGGDTGYNWVLIDNIKIDSLDKVDLAVTNIYAPVVAEPDEEFTISARVSNIGNEGTDSYTATLNYNGSPVQNKSMGHLDSGKFETIEFTHSLNVSSPIGNTFSISVEAAGDNNKDNNVSEEITVARNLNLLPEPERVAYDLSANTLAWVAPDMSKAAPALFVDDFESYPCIEGDLENDFENAWVTFLPEAGDWIFIDRDQCPIGGMMKFGEAGYEYIEFPGIEVHSPQSWWVQNRLFMDFNDTYYGHDNSWQYLANMYVVNEDFNAAMPQDDWAITPELCGREQLLTFWARSYDPNIPEAVEFLYSTGSTNPEDFKLIRRIDQLSGDWTQYAVVIPEGGKRFAIRGCSYVHLGSAQTFVDDVAFYPAQGEKQNLNFIGYNIYCDNKLMNSTPVTQLLFTDINPSQHTYAVSAVYEEGESKAVLATEGAGIEDILSDSVRVNSSNGVIYISGLKGMEYSVASTSGIIHARGNNVNNIDIHVGQGVYIVKAGKKVVKVIVK